MRRRAKARAPAPSADAEHEAAPARASDHDADRRAEQPPHLRDRPVQHSFGYHEREVVGGAGSERPVEDRPQHAADHARVHGHTHETSQHEPARDQHEHSPPAEPGRHRGRLLIAGARLGAPAAAQRRRHVQHDAHEGAQREDRPHRLPAEERPDHPHQRAVAPAHRLLTERQLRQLSDQEHQAGPEQARLASASASPAGSGQAAKASASAVPPMENSCGNDVGPAVAHGDSEQEGGRHRELQGHERRAQQRQPPHPR